MPVPAFLKISRKAFVISFLSLVALVAIAAIAASLWLSAALKHGLPDYSGQAEIAGLSDAVHIYRDEYGVPHIFAANMDDAARALGYVHASERMFQMEMQRRAGQGRLSEVVGSDMLGVDKFIRTLGLYELAESSADAQSPEAKRYFQAYADGVNAWLNTHKDNLPPEFALLHIHPEPWKPADSVVWGKLMGLQLSHNYKLEMLRAQMAMKLDKAQMRDLFFPELDNLPITTFPRLMKKTENETPAAADDAQTRLGRWTTLDHGASNEWVISGKRTDTGKPILANDPHLGLEAPILWYLARIVTPELAIKGGTVPGLPIVLLGQNDHIAWGFTTTGSDVEDLFIETVDPKNADSYLAPGSDGKPVSEKFATRREVIHVHNGLDVTLNVRSTRHGPVLSDIDPEMAALAGDGKVMALAFTGLGDHDLTAEALMRLNRAKDWDDFTKALTLYQTPPQNVVYADNAGNIGFYNPGLVPVRKKGQGLVPVDGASGDYDWIGMIPFTWLPHLYNPAAGFIFNANNPVSGADLPYFMGLDWEEPYRAERLQQFFDTLPKHSLATSAMMQADHLSLAARDLLPYLRNLAPDDAESREAVEMLKHWDGVMDKDKPEPLIFEAWLYQMHKIMLVGKAQDRLTEKGPFDASSLAFILSQYPEDWCSGADGKPTSDCSAVTAKALKDALAMLDSREKGAMKDWKWGNEHITLLQNKVFSHVPFIGARVDLSIPSSGDFYTLDRGGSFTLDHKHLFARTHGGGYRGIYDLADPDQSRFMIATGESGHILSPHYGDLTPLWNDVKSFTLAGAPKDLVARNLPELVLQPAR